MLEIVMIIALARKIGAIVESKGHKAGRYKFLAVVLWIGGEILGGIMGGIIVALSDASEILIYLFALAGAVAGALIAYVIARNLSPVEFSAPPPPPIFN